MANPTLTGSGSAVSSAKESASVALTSATAAASSAAAASDAGKVALGRNGVWAIGFAFGCGFVWGGGCCGVSMRRVFRFKAFKSVFRRL